MNPLHTTSAMNLDTLNHELFLLYKRIVKEIRVVDKKHAIFLNGSVWSTNFDVFKEIFDDNIVYEFHKYWFDVNQDAIQTYLDFSKNTTYQFILVKPVKIQISG